MGEITFSVSVPFTEEKPKYITAAMDTTVGALMGRASQLFRSVSTDDYNILVSLKDGTYDFVQSEEVISGISLPANPSIILAKKEFQITVHCAQVKPVELTVSNKETIESILTRTCKEIGSRNPENFVVCVEEEDSEGEITYDVLAASMSIVEQRPDAKRLTLMEAGNEKVKLNFIDVYLKGSVFLALSDALQLSAYLLRAVKGPYRRYNGTVLGVRKFLPKSLKHTHRACDELVKQWSFLVDCTKEEATRKFKKNVQQLPLFNCTSFTCKNAGDAANSRVSSQFELILTEKRMIFLDHVKFKSRLSIAYRDMLKMSKDDDEITFIYYDNGDEKKVTFETNTSTTLFRKVAMTVKSLESSDDINPDLPCTFREKQEIEDDATRINYFPTDFIYEFLNKDESEDHEGRDNDSSLSYSEVMHALVLRADACAWHLSVLLSKVTSSNAKQLKSEITAYYARLMAYLTWLTYDQRPYDLAVPIGDLLQELDVNYNQARDIIHEVCQLMTTVKKMFVPISNDPIHVASSNAMGYVIAHLFSYVELPWAVKDSDGTVFEKLIDDFMKNACEFKKHINSYLYTVGNVDLKTDMQNCIDFLFMHHLSSLALLPNVIESSDLGELDPSVILHYDSCNIMMSTVMEFARLLWENRRELTDDQLQAFLNQAAALARELLPIEKPLKIHIKTIEEFLKIVDLNLPCLKSSMSMWFMTFKEYATKLIGASEIVNDLELPHVYFRYIQSLSVLVYIQPTVLADEVTVVMDKLKFLTKNAYAKIVADISLFDLVFEEGHDPSTAALKCYIAENLKPTVEGDDVFEISEMVFPILSLQQMIGRVVSEWCRLVVRIIIWRIVFINAVFANVVWQTKTQVAAGKLLVNEETKKRLEELTAFNESTSCFPASTPERNASVLQLLEADTDLTANEEFAVCRKLMSQTAEEKYYLKVKKFTCHEDVKIMTDAICTIAQMTYSEVNALLKTNLAAAMSRFAALYLTASIFRRVLREVATQPSYFMVPKLIIKMDKSIAAIEQGLIGFFVTGKLNTKQMEKFQGLNSYVREALKFSKYTDLTSLYKIEDFKKPEPIDSNKKACRRTDMTDMIAEYRMIKNDMAECLMLREKENLEIVAGRLGEAVGNIVAFINTVDSDNHQTQYISENFTTFCNELPAIYGYKLSVTHMRACLEPLDMVLDEAIEDIASRMYEAVTPQKLNDLSEGMEKKDWESSDRASFVQVFTEALRPLLLQLQNSDEMQIIYDILNLIQDNEIGEVKFLVSTLSEQKEEILKKVMKESKYVKYIRQIEKAAERIEFVDCFIWFKNGVKKLVDKLKFENMNDAAADAMNSLVQGMDEDFSPDVEHLERCAANIASALEKLDIPELRELEQNCQIAQDVLPKLIETIQRFDDSILASKDFSGISLTYKESIRHIVDYFGSEYLLQIWDHQPFVNLCDTAMNPLRNDYSSESVADALIFARHLMRSLRLGKRTVQAEFLTTCDKLITASEKACRDFYARSQTAHEATMSKQKAIVDGFVTSFKNLDDGNIKRFVVRLMSNLSLDLATMNSFDAGRISESVAGLFNDLKASNDRLVQVNVLIKWIENMDRDILPVDYDKLLEILRKLLETMDAPAEAEFMLECDQDALVELAVQLSSALAQLGALRSSLRLVKDMHKLWPIKEGFIKYINIVMRTFEAYAEEIHTFAISAHPVLGVIKSIPTMCVKLEAMIEASFMLTYTERHAEEAIASMKAFVESCPKDVIETMEELVQEPIQLIQSIKE